MSKQGRQRRRSSQLGALFDDLNERFFGGRLPRYRVVRSSKLKECVIEGDCDRERLLIRISPGIEGDELRRVLVHEMCHHEAQGHGPEFLAQLEMLERAGEDWIGEERERCLASDERPFGEQLQEALDDIAAMPEIATWRAVRDYIAVDRFGIRGPELERLARWAKTFWKARWALYHGRGVGSRQVAA